MSSPLTNGHAPALQPDPAAVREHLRLILESPAFKGSRRSQAFLEYTVEKVLAGHHDSLKERNIAVDVFGRAPDANLTEDTIVRVGAREVRRRLAQFYSSPAAASAPFHIDLPAGSYAPEFTTPTPAAPPPSPTPSSRRLHPAWLAALALIPAAALTFYFTRDPLQRPFDLFWRPLLHNRPSLLCVVPAPVVYHPSLRATLKDEARFPAPPSLGQRPLRLPPQELNGADMVPVIDQYVGVGDLIAVSELKGLTARSSTTLRLRLASRLEFAELRESPAILIGAFTNRWALELSKSWPISFGLTPDRRPTIQESSGQRRVWALNQWNDDGSTRDDFILIARVLSTSSGQPVTVAAGLKQFGTEAAGRILSNPSQLAPLLAKLPPDWPNRSLVLVLHARVIDNAPAAPDLLAWRLW